MKLHLAMHHLHDLPSSTCSHVDGYLNGCMLVGGGSLLTCGWRSVSAQIHVSWLVALRLASALQNVATPQLPLQTRKELEGVVSGSDGSLPHACEGVASLTLPRK